MAYIYQITNNVNGKIDVGKTERTIEERFKEHCYDAFKRKSEQRPLYFAMRKYGIDNFSISLLEETNNPEEREIYWIEQKRSYKCGYNATKGGDGRRYVDYDLVIATYKELQNMSKVATLIGISVDTVSRILKDNQIETLTSQEVSQKLMGKPINQYDLNGNYIKTFPSSTDAAIALGKLTSTSRGASSHISDVCKGKRKTAYGYIWKYA